MTDRLKQLLGEIIVHASYGSDPACWAIGELAREAQQLVEANATQAEEPAPECACDPTDGMICLFHFEQRQKASVSGQIPEQQRQIRELSAALRGTFDNRAR